MHIHNACLPDVPDLAKLRSNKKAMRGRYPKSSKRANSGKKIAIGGSITDTTTATV
ncbi:hypothetical protein FACS1894211_08580 [Clostridia bacterium]|nr:hypothetical protein FACS1894211_08580 [Clostridia bacterium]